MKPAFTAVVEYLTAVASVAAILAVLYFTWPIHKSAKLEKMVKTSIVILDVEGMKKVYDLDVSQRRFYKRHDHADAFFRRWLKLKSIVFPLEDLDKSEFQRPGKLPDEIDWQAELLAQATARMTVPVDTSPNFDSVMQLMFRLPMDEFRNVGFITPKNIMSNISQEFSNKRLAPFVDAYSRSRRIFTPALIENNSKVDARNVSIVVNTGQYPGAEFLGVSTTGSGEAKTSLLPAHKRMWFFIRTSNAPVEAKDIFISQEGESIEGGLLAGLLLGSAALLLVGRIYAWK
ncbi:MAG: hypothetical protein WCU88_05940 [Elusimicrobiota bacterium]